MQMAFGAALKELKGFYKDQGRTAAAPARLLEAGGGVL
jgi:hypothetical protein